MAASSIRPTRSVARLNSDAAEANGDTGGAGGDAAGVRWGAARAGAGAARQLAAGGALAGAQLRPFLRGRLGPTVAEVAAADALELAARLHEEGHMPRVDAALRLVSEPRRAYPGLVDEQVLEFLLVSLLAFRQARPEQL